MPKGVYARKPLNERLLSKFEIDELGCWIWKAYIDPYGYGRIDGRVPHRVSYELAHGSIPVGLTIDHLCRNRACINPEHLEAVTSRVNTLRGNTVSARNLMKTQCHSGHTFDVANTHICKESRRHCRSCSRDRMRKRRASLSHDGHEPC